MHRIFKVVKRKNTELCTHVLTASGNQGLIDQQTYFNRNVSGSDLSNYYLIRNGEFAYNRSSMIGYPYGAIKRLDTYQKGVLSTLYLCFAIKDLTQSTDFYNYYFESGILNKQLRGIVQVGARAHGLLNVTTHEFMNVKIPIPTIEEQNRISKTLSICDNEIKAMSRYLEYLQSQKKGLMQKLLTGEIRVNTEREGELV